MGRLSYAPLTLCAVPDETFILVGTEETLSGQAVFEVLVADGSVVRTLTRCRTATISQMTCCLTTLIVAADWWVKVYSWPEMAFRYTWYWHSFDKRLDLGAPCYDARMMTNAPRPPCDDCAFFNYENGCKLSLLSKYCTRGKSRSTFGHVVCSYTRLSLRLRHDLRQAWVAAIALGATNVSE